MIRHERVEIVGAGPAGLSAALAASAGGARVTVYEKRADVGMRFHGDFQGLENWTSDYDVLAQLDGLGIRPDFDYRPVYEFVCFDPGGRAHPVRSAQPIFYLLRRGRDAGTLDQALKAQALAAGVDIRFGERRRHLERGGIVAEGPHRADAIAAGYQFETDMADGCYGAISEALAPGGYSYLLVDRGRGTVATCMFADFHNERHFVEATGISSGAKRGCAGATRRGSVAAGTSIVWMRHPLGGICSSEKRLGFRTAFSDSDCAMR